MAKKKKNQENLPEGMSRRQAKLAARAAERAALQRDPRPYKDFAEEANLIALQEFVPAAHAELDVKGIDRKVQLVTVLPGAVAAVVREEGEGEEAMVALQRQHSGPNPHKDLAFALNWLKDAKPGDTLGTAIADGNQPELSELIDPKQTLDIKVEQDFFWWLPEGTDRSNPQVVQSLQHVNDTLMPSAHIDVDVPGAVWWIDAGEKAHIRWVRLEDEETLLTALARVSAAGELNLGEDTRFAGVYRTHGIVVPVFDLDPTVDADSYKSELERVDKAIAKALEHKDQGLESLTADERKARDNIRSRQVTIL